MLNLDLDLRPFYEMMDDKIMSKLIENLSGLKNSTALYIFEALIDSITEQQISLKTAHSIKRK